MQQLMHFACRAAKKGGAPSSGPPKKSGPPTSGGGGGGGGGGGASKPASKFKSPGAAPGPAAAGSRAAA